MTTATRHGSKQWAHAIGREARELAGTLRRMAVKRTTGALWQVVGHLLFDGSKETRDVEVASGIGFYARPKSAGRCDAIVVFPNGAMYPVVIATRDEDTRKKVANDLAEDETQVHNSQAVVRIKANGTIEARSANGTAVPLATKADVQALRDFASGLLYGGTGSAVVPGWPNPAGTTKLKGE